MVRIELLSLKAVMLNSIELLAHGARMLFTHIPNTLEICAVSLSSLCQAFIHERFKPVLEKGMLVFDFGVTVLPHTFELAEILWVSRRRTSKLLQLLVELCDSLIIDSILS